MAVLELTLFLVIIVFVCVFLRRKKSSLSAFPGPSSLPWIGNVHQIDLANPQITFMRWSKLYGEVFKIKTFGQDLLVVNTYDTIYEVLVSKGQDFAGRPNDFRTNYITLNQADIFFQSPNPRWNYLRKTAHKHLKMYSSGMKRIEEINMAIIGEMVKAFKGYEGKEFNPREIVYNTIMNIAALFTVGKTYSVDSTEFKLFETSEKLLFRNLSFAGKGVELDIFPWLRYLGNSTFKRLQRYNILRDKLYNILKKYVEENANKDDQNKVEGVLFALWRLYEGQSEADKMSEKGLCEDNVKGASLDVVYAGTSTTVSSYHSYLNIIAQHPGVQKRLQEEVDDVVGTSKIVSLSDRDQMPFTRATVLETLRYTSVVALGVPHVTVKDTTLNGKPVPAEIKVLTNLFALHHDEKFWGDPYTFRPDRFLDDTGALLLPSANERKHLMPFGAGPRVCLGEILALSRLFLLLATTSQIFYVKPGTITQSCDPRSYDFGALIYPKDYEVCMQCRNTKLFVEN